MAKVWEKGGEGLHPLVEKYEVGQDYLLDGKLYYYELVASLAHAKMLHHIGVLSDNEYKSLSHAIKDFYRMHGREIALTVSDEDIHSKLENQLTEQLGDVGKKLHTGRSRNDQVLVVLRLYEKDAILSIVERALNLLSVMAEVGEKHFRTVLPGYTHTKQAMLMTVGFWMAGFIEMGMDNLWHLASVYQLIDANPLGSGSGFGVPLALDRDMTTRLLGFERVHYSPLAVQNSRGKLEGMIIDALWNWMCDGSRLAADLLTWNMDELLFIETSPAITTGSSLMPQKRNLDVMELVRARSSVVLSYAQQVKMITNGLLSGYNRDMQETKEPLMRSFQIVEETLDVLALVIQNIRFNEDAIKKALSKGIFATDMVFEAVGKGMPFRDAYKHAASVMHTLEVNDNLIQESLQKRVSPGSPLTYDYDAIKTEIHRQKKIWGERTASFRNALDHLLKED